ncbi:hypothetical protein GCM10020254_32800 [Streptomyces goshikiensis]
MRQLWGQERVISGNRQTSWAFADAFVAEDDALRWARDRSREAGLRSVSPGTGAALRLLAATADAKAVAEIGTGTGVSGIHLLHGMRPDGVLTTVDPEPDRQAFARQAFRAAGFAGNRARFIPGRALDVLPRLADGGYDLVFCDGDPTESLDYLAESLRLLQPRRAGLLRGRLLRRPDGRLRRPGRRGAPRPRAAARRPREPGPGGGAAPGGRRPAVRGPALKSRTDRMTRMGRTGGPGARHPVDTTLPRPLVAIGAAQSSDC